MTSGKGNVPWDHGSWHHAVMGVGLQTDRGPAAITWTSLFHPYGIEVFDEPIEAQLSLGPDGPEPTGPEGRTTWTELQGQVCRGVTVTWWRLELGPGRLSDGTVVTPASVVDVPVAIRLDLEGEPVWFVAAIPGQEGLAGAFMGGDEIIVVFHPSHARALGVKATPAMPPAASQVMLPRDWEQLSVDPEGYLRAPPSPVLLDEWQLAGPDLM